MFAYRLTLFRLFGFTVRVDATWLLLAGLIIWTLAAGYFPQVVPGLESRTYWWMALVGLLGLAFSIVVHEFAHSLVARRFNMPIRGITLFIFGGVAEMEDEPTSPKGELLMALAGPATSVVVALLFAGLAWVIGAGALTGEGSPPPVAVVFAYLAAINALLAVFNMVPAFPLDGGRVLRAALWWWRKDIVWATRIAAAAGSVFGIVLITLGLITALGGNVVGGVWWFVLGLFVQFAASSQMRQQYAMMALSGVPVRRFMRNDPVTVPPSLPLDRLVDDYFYRYFYKSFPVTDGNRLLGSVTLDAVRETDLHRRGLITVDAILQPVSDNNTVSPDEDSAKALRRMQQSGLTRLLVTRDHRLVGVISLRDLMTVLQIRAALGEAFEDHAADGRLRKAS